MKTYSAKPSELKASWYIVDASGQTLGRLAANVAKILRGKHKPIYTPHLNTGDHVIVVNVKGIRVTGKKDTDKIYTSYTGYPGGLRKRAYGSMVERHPTFPFRHAVSGMLQHGTLGKAQLRRHVRPGRCGPARYRPGALCSRPGDAAGAEEARHADPRPAHEGAQETRPQARPQSPAVHQALGITPQQQRSTGPKRSAVS